MQEASRYEVVLQITLIRISILICSGTLNFDVPCMYIVISIILSRNMYNVPDKLLIKILNQSNLYFPLKMKIYDCLRHFFPTTRTK